MCGRSRCTLAEEQLQNVAGNCAWVNRESYRPSYNVTPGSDTPVILRDASGSVVVQTMRWGLVPSFTAAGAKPDHWKMFNARSETMAEKPVFKRLLPSKRCLVVLDGFYEWKKERDGKAPFYIHFRGGEVMVMAGLYDLWQSEQGPLYTYTILTTDSSKRLAWLHDRMPVILRDKAAQQLWMGPATQGGEAGGGRLQKIVGPYNGDDLVWYPVTRAMNSPAFQGPECCKEIKKPSAAAFFQARKPKQGPADAAAIAAGVGTGVGGAGLAGGGEGKGEGGGGGGPQIKADAGATVAAAASPQEQESLKMEAGCATAVEPATAAAAGAANVVHAAADTGAGTSAAPAATVNADERPVGGQEPAEAAGPAEGTAWDDKGQQGARAVLSGSVPGEPSALEAAEGAGGGPGDLAEPSDEEGPTAGPEVEGDGEEHQHGGEPIPGGPEVTLDRPAAAEGEGAGAPPGCGGNAMGGAADSRGTGKKTPATPTKRRAEAGGVGGGGSSKKASTPAKRAAGGMSGGGGGKSLGGSAKKKGRPPGQPAITQFLKH